MARSRICSYRHRGSVCARGRAPAGGDPGSGRRADRSDARAASRVTPPQRPPRLCPRSSRRTLPGQPCDTLQRIPARHMRRCRPSPTQSRDARPLPCLREPWTLLPYRTIQTDVHQNQPGHREPCSVLWHVAPQALHLVYAHGPPEAIRKLSRGGHLLEHDVAREGRVLLAEVVLDHFHKLRQLCEVGLRVALGEGPL